MPAEISASQVILVVFNLLILCLAFFVRLWINRLQAENDSNKKKIQELTDALHAYQLQCARDFAPRSEVSNGRQEMMELMHQMSGKVDRIYDKLDKKADKP